MNLIGKLAKHINLIEGKKKLYHYQLAEKYMRMFKSNHKNLIENFKTIVIQMRIKIHTQITRPERNILKFYFGICVKPCTCPTPGRCRA